MTSGRGFNGYRQDGTTTLLFLTNRQGDVTAEALIDTADLDMLIALGQRWCLHKGYVVSCINTREQRTYLQLHRVLLGLTSPDVKGDHINRNPMDNRRANLRAVDHITNSRNRHGRSDTGLGIRNVSVMPASKSRPFRVALGDSKNRTFVTYVRTLNLARITAVMARAEFWGAEAAA